jgi:DcuC family C4-dicarboxylate transporter
MSAAAGRTMSPVAAVALMSAKLTGTSSFVLAKRVAGPLLISLALVLVLRVLGIV